MEKIELDNIYLKAKFMERMLKELSDTSMNVVHMSHDLRDMGFDPDKDNDYTELRRALAKFSSLVGLYYSSLDKLLEED